MTLVSLRTTPEHDHGRRAPAGRPAGAGRLPVQAWNRVTRMAWPRIGSARAAGSDTRAGRWRRTRPGQPGHPGGLHHPQSQPLQRTRVIAGPCPPRGDAPPGGQFSLLVEGPLGKGVQRDAGVREMVLDAGQERADLFFRQVGQHPVGHEEVRPRALRDDGQPFLAGHRRGHHPAAVRSRRRTSAAARCVRQVQVDPVHLAVVHPLEAAVQPGADLHHRACRVAGPGSRGPRRP